MENKITIVWIEGSLRYWEWPKYGDLIHGHYQARKDYIECSESDLVQLAIL